MPLFTESKITQAYLKMGLMGFAGDGKTFTATNVAIGLIQLMREKGLDIGDRPAYFLDTETGSDWVQPQFEDAGIKLYTSKTRAFKELIPHVKEAEANGSLLIIDSISHFWKEIMESYTEKMNRKKGLIFPDWAWLKKEWGKFTDEFVNSQLHIIMCGRAGYEYDFFDNEDGKKELIKTGVKMKAETETGYEPSILVLMAKYQNEDKTLFRSGTIMKDRANLIDGKIFKNPTFQDFKPHIDFLNLGGEHIGVDTQTNSKDMIAHRGKSKWQKDRDEAGILLEEVKDLLIKHYPSTKADDKTAKADLLEKHFSNRTWARLETFKLDVIQKGYDSLFLELEGVEAHINELIDDDDLIK